MVAQRTRSRSGSIWILITFLLGAMVLVVPALSGFAVLDTPTTIPSSAPAAEREEELLIGGVLVKVASQHDEAEEVFTYAKETFGRLPPTDFKALSSRVFRNRGYEAVLYAVRHPTFGWSGVFIRAWQDSSRCTVPTVFAFESEDWMRTVISRDGYRWPANILEACGGSFPRAPKFRR